jgi:hypothetical protein
MEAKPPKVEESGFVDSLWMTPEEFQLDEKAVKAWRAFIATTEGKKLYRVIRGLNPASRLATIDTVDPKMMRAVAAAEAQSEGTLLGKITGFQLIENLLFQVLVKHKKAQPQPHSRRSGKREIAPHSVSLP